MHIKIIRLSNTSIEQNHAVNQSNDVVLGNKVVELTSASIAVRTPADAPNLQTIHTK